MIKKEKKQNTLQLYIMLLSRLRLDCVADAIAGQLRAAA